jgi:hypothetical protein
VASRHSSLLFAGIYPEKHLNFHIIITTTIIIIIIIIMRRRMTTTTTTTIIIINLVFEISKAKFVIS